MPPLHVVALESVKSKFLVVDTLVFNSLLFLGKDSLVQVIHGREVPIEDSPLGRFRSVVHKPEVGFETPWIGSHPSRFSICYEVL